ncbi:MAG: zf-HC2 domain-containing protein [Acidobacteriota bacterium]
MSNTNKNCDMHEALVSYLYNEATPEEGRRVEAHLTECSGCKHELAAFDHVRGLLQQWQIDEMPVVRVVTEPRRSALSVLKELFTLTPIWAKALGAVAMAMLVLAVMGTEVSIGSGGFSARVDLLHRGRGAQPAVSQIDPNTAGSASLEQIRALVNSMIIDSERQQRDDLKAQLVGLESQLSSMRSADLVKLSQRIQDHQARLKTIERDIDRREGLDLTDILFSEVTNKPARASIAAQGGGD